MPCQVFFFDPWENDFLDKNQEKQFFLCLCWDFCVIFKHFLAGFPCKERRQDITNSSSAIYFVYISKCEVLWLFFLVEMVAVLGRDWREGENIKQQFLKDLSWNSITWKRYLQTRVRKVPKKKWNVKNKMYSSVLG